MIETTEIKNNDIQSKTNQPERLLARLIIFFYTLASLSQSLLSFRFSQLPFHSISIPFHSPYLSHSKKSLLSLTFPYFQPPFRFTPRQMFPFRSYLFFFLSILFCVIHSTISNLSLQSTCVFTILSSATICCSMLCRYT